MRKVAIASWKGGVGRTGVAVNLGVALSRMGRRVLLIDADSQGNATKALSIDPEATGGTNALMHDAAAVADVAVAVEENLALVPASQALGLIDLWLADQGKGWDLRGSVLRERLKGLRGHDYAIIDTSPAFSLLNVNALAWASEVWSPCSMELWAIDGVAHVADAIGEVRQLVGHAGKLAYVVPTFYDRRNAKSDIALEALRRLYGDKVTPPIRTNVRISEAAAVGMSVLDFAPRAAGSEDFRALAERIIRDE